jgi:hypothetical protein
MERVLRVERPSTFSTTQLGLAEIEVTVATVRRPIAIGNPPRSSLLIVATSAINHDARSARRCRGGIGEK